MKMQFDKIIDRKGSNAVKTDCLIEKYGRDDLIPLWIADMDFETPDFIRKALADRFAHPIYGYSEAPESYWQSILDWEKNVNGWELNRDEITFIPGIIRGISYAINCFTQPGDKVVLQPPVYMPFFRLVEENGRKIILNPLKLGQGQYEMDIDGLETLCRLERPKMMILANPHNPAGRVWGRATLAKVAAICDKYHVLVVSDEIHADMPLFGNVHVPFASVSPEAANVAITFKAPSKTFNIAGISSSYAIVRNPVLRREFYDFLTTNEFNVPTFMAFVATEAAFTKGDRWRREMLKYVEENVNIVTDYIGVNIPQISVMRPQASFLVWLNCKRLGLEHDALIDLFVDKAHLALNDGAAFGPGGDGYMRLNVGCPRKVLEKALAQLKDAVKSLK